jgi:hypothetical protein
MAAGFVVYFTYGRFHSRIELEADEAANDENLVKTAR